MSSGRPIATEVKNDLNTEKFKSKIEYEDHLNMAFFKIFSDYFNVISQNKKLMKEQKVSDLRFLKSKIYHDTIDLINWWDETDVMFKYDNFEINFAFDKYKANKEIHYTLVVTSQETTYLNNSYIYKEILKNALTISNLKGSYIEMPRNNFSWQRKELEKRDFTDISLPPNTLEDLKLFIDIFNKKGKMMRYLMVGNPGTGKTESTLILANELKKCGVTILKTPVCDLLKEKLELAEALAPTMILFDDLDLSIGSRSKGGYSPKELQTFLDAMDGTDKISEDVGIVATTNSAHLLDLAAQRPGRFEKIITFDKLSKRNIGDIIIKSLKYNFDILKINGDKKVIDLFFNKEVVNRFYIAKVTGAHIFTSIKMMKLKGDMLYENYNLDWVLSELDNEINTLDKIRKSGQISDKLEKNQGSSVGFGNATLDEDDIDWDGDEDKGMVEGEESVRRTKERRE